ncbi:MAG: hypothetical protein A2504_13605 [Bdellovibrionales bacterium RIFOXYD12_FULL_39_22]|nr:MAG: hypothetical protein A2385_00330 [Bdellovibrionales bacterium RIFOXYB1_FULL_39_21]OFZ43876.1 MAG: hypothetical protein A2485_05200 [Bdellovibrionales bacterium RIFOXYC12_FULL_39_17]OFZ76523.1 MAG: hypothetical protein A2560_06310 [Bdellovibrionales bacterium RIFOXYD1_FULL_39_84]OFZ94757.1 MAG: hypothetical protein A2504_13605 [Bdellovibrionales bacterium RIFOXYD12_FULL_39_22]
MSFFFSFFIPKLFFHINTENLVDKNSLSSNRLEKLQQDFPTKNSLYLFFHSPTPFVGNTLCTIDSWLKAQGRHNTHISAIRSPFFLRRPQVNNELLFYPYLIPPPCLKENRDKVYDFSLIDQSPWRQILTTKAGDFFGVEILFHDTPGGSQFGKFDPAILRAFKHEFDSFIRNTLPTIKTDFLGHMGYFHYGIEGLAQTNLLNVALILLLIFLCKLAFGTYKSGLLLTLTLVMMGGVLYGAMALFGSPVDTLNAGLFLIVTIAVAEDFFFLSVWQLQHPKDHEDLFVKFLVPCFFTSFTTIIGFGSLCLTDLTIIQRFGFWAAFGALWEWLLIFFFLPAFLQLFPNWKIWTDQRKARFYKFSKRILLRQLPSPLIRPLIILGCFSLFLLFHLKIADAPFKIFPQDHPFRAGILRIQEKSGWQVSFDMIFENKDDQVFNEMIMQKLANDPLISFVQNPYEIERYYTQDFPPLTQKLILREYSWTTDYKRHKSSQGQLHSTIFGRENSIEDFSQLIAKINTWCENGKRCYPTGDAISFAEIAMQIPKVLIESFFYSVFFVTAILVFILAQTGHGSVRNIFATLVSSLWGPSIMILIFWAFGVSLNFITCTFASVLVGLTGDNAVQFIFAARRKNISVGIVEQGVSSIHIAIITFLASSVFLFSYFEAMRTMGLLTATGIVIMNFGDIWPLKKLLS